jgi:hypothetical protein
MNLKFDYIFITSALIISCKESRGTLPSNFLAFKIFSLFLNNNDKITFVVCSSFERI